MALSQHRQGGVYKVSGQFSGAGTITAGKGFTVAAPGSGVYTITLLGPEPIGTKIMVLTSMAHANDFDGLTDAVVANCDYSLTTAATGVITIVTTDVGGVKENAQSDAYINFEATVWTSTQVV